LTHWAGTTDKESSKPDWRPDRLLYNSLSSA
jgi:hypothetical protein